MISTNFIPQKINRKIYYLLAFILLIIFLIFFLIILYFLLLQIDPDEPRTLHELIESRGFRLKTYKVTTSDGYILRIHRIVPPNFNPQTYSKTRKPVIAFHGTGCASSIFFIASPLANETFGFRLMLTGRYDLWIPNARGNGLSNDHVDLTEESSDFWKFSFEHIGLYDIPAVINLVRRKTGHRTVGYIGYSLGGGAAIALFTLQPEYASMIQPFIGFAPAVYFEHMGAFPGTFAKWLRPILERLPGRVLTTGSFAKIFLRWWCRPEFLGFHRFCSIAYSLIMGPSTSLNVSRIPVYAANIPAGISTWQVAHYAQLQQSKRFTRFRYPDEMDNLKAYHLVSPPDFPLGNIPKSLNMIIMYGATDVLVSPEDSYRLIQELRAIGLNVIEYRVPSERWSHFDFAVGLGAGQLVYAKAIEFLDRFVVQDGPG